MKFKIKFWPAIFSITGFFYFQLFAPLVLNAQKNHRIMDSGVPKDSVIFNFKSEAQVWVVPKGVTQIHIDASGAQGGGEKGGNGGNVQTDLTVSPGTTLNIFVGSQPKNAEGGYNGGGKGCGKGYGGGGATDVRIGGIGLQNRVVVAGGGGGGSGLYGGDGSGEGGGPAGGDGKSIYDEKHIAHGGTQESGGAGARAYLSKPGTTGTGGDGISNSGKCSNDMMCGGGGGYYGGGGGGAGSGGGGSSYTDSNNRNVVHNQGANKGDGSLKIYWEKVTN